MESNYRDKMQCPCYTECKDCAPGFQKVIDLKNAGLVIYRHTTHTEDVDTKTGNVEHAVDTTEDVYILHNTTDKDVSSADYWPEIEQNTITCPRCKKIKEQARKLLKKGPTVSGYDIKGICDHCKMKDASCYGCQEVVKSFVPSKPERTDVGKERVKHWLGKIKVLLDDTSKAKKMAHSDIYTDQLCRNLKNPVRELDVEQLFGPKHLDSDSTIQPSTDKKKVAHFNQLEKIEHPILFKDPLKRGGMSSFANEDLEFSYTDSDISKTMLHAQPEKEKHSVIKYNTPPNNREVLPEVDRFANFEQIFEDKIPLTGLKQKATTYYKGTSKQKYGDITHGHGYDRTDFRPDKQVTKDIYGRPVKLPYDNGQWSNEANLNQKAHFYTKLKDSQDGRQRKYNSTETLVTKVKDITLGHLKANSIIFPSRSHHKHLTKYKSSSELIKHTANKILVKAKEEISVVTEHKQTKQQSNKVFPQNKIPGERTETDNIEKVKIEKHSSSAEKKGQKALKLAEKTQKDAHKAALKAELDAQKAALIAEKNAKQAEKDSQQAKKDARQTRNDAHKTILKAEADAQKAALVAEKNAAKAEKDARKAEKDAAKADKDVAKAEKDAAKDKKYAAKAEKNAAKDKKDAEKAEKDALKAAKLAQKLDSTSKKSKKAENDALQAKNDARQAQHKAQKEAEKAEMEALKADEKALKENAEKALKENAGKAEKHSLLQDKMKKGSFDSLSERARKNNNMMKKLPENRINTDGETGNLALDDLISKLVKLKQLAHEGRSHHTCPELRITQNYIDLHCEQHTHQKNEHCLLCANSDIALEFASLCPNNEIKKELSDIIVGQQILKFRPPRATVQEEGVSEEKGTEEHEDNISAHRTAAVTTDQSIGYLRYSLSDRKFIDNGWTQLPTEKVVRKMNVYRMRPARPEFDWFEHNKNKRLMQYDTGEKLAEFDDNGRGRWFYRNGRMALVYYDAEEQHAGQRFVVYSNGEPDERGRSRPYTLLATFDYLGNGIVFDHGGKIRLKYNQTEGVVLDRSIGPVSHWKWHTLNDPPVLQQVMLDTQIPHKDPEIMKMGKPGEDKPKKDDEDMLAIEFDNIVKEKSKKLSQTFRPFQIRMKALKINEHFSLRVLDQATVYLFYRDGTTNLKLNIGMVLDNKEIVDTDTADVGDVSNNLEKLPARTESLAGLQKSIAIAQQYDRIRTERERKLHPGETNASFDKLIAGISRPIPRQLLTTEPLSGSPMITAADLCKCNRKPTATNVYYDTRFY